MTPTITTEQAMELYDRYAKPLEGEYIAIPCRAGRSSRLISPGYRGKRLRSWGLNTASSR